MPIPVHANGEAKDLCEARVVDVIAEAVVQIEKEAGRLKED